ncbi:hypothetical protein IC232_23405 [Microvirga sp. BT688]|uniref:DUF6455 family protein n=1 Tax=Microvirga sp. TaxID=1873136 RepID=UPI0016873946|nr:DUF6455 family protein [Microvirga sp.]MBD2749629.1 hypothetical protein [Microvirga sp.]
MGLAATIRQWRSILAQAHEFDALGPDQREALARDIGVPEDVVVRLVARGAKAGAELPRLMQALSLDPEGIRHWRAALMRDMSVSCSECAAVARCRRDLDRGQASLTYRGYCPNAETLRELRGERSVDLSFS